MEGLIKGLVHVAIDAVEDALGERDHGGDDDAPRRRAPHRAAPDAGEEEEGRDERSRSTWAEVVSGEQDDERRDHRSSGREKRPGRREDEGWERWDGRRQQHHSSASAWQSQYEGEDRRDGGSRWRRQQQQAQGYKRQQQEGEKINDGGWQTIGEKKHHGRPQQSEAWNGYRRPPSEQKYSEDFGQIHHGLNVEPTREELNSLSKACSRLWELDMNRLVPGKDYRIECGEGKKVYKKGDMASENLFSWLGDDVLRKPTYSRFCALLDNYNPHQGYKEVVTEQDEDEEVAFIEEIARTAPIKYLHQYLVQKGAASHWIQFYLEEAKGNVDYQCYIFPRRRGESPDSETQLLTVQFEWHGVLKSVSSTLIGVSPEFEVALYTLCFFVGGEDNRVDIGPYTVNIKCYRMGNKKIGSAFPIAEN